MTEKDDLHKYLIIVAGGLGRRMGSQLPKQFLPIGGRPVIMHSIDRFTEVYPDIEIIVVLPALLEETWKELAARQSFVKYHHTVAGGEQRFDSVKNGLALVSKKSLVAVHDAARPFVNSETIINCFKGAALLGNSIPVVNPSESLREVHSDGSSHVLDRSAVRLIQTPQVFRSEILINAYNRTLSPEYTDDAAVVEAAGEKIHLVEGNPENIKITTPADLIIGEGILKSLLK